MSKIRVSKYCGCPFSAVMEFAEKTLSQRLAMHVSPGPALSESVYHVTRLVDDRTDQTRLHDALLVAWKPEHPELFPDFRGILTARPMHRGAMITLEGSYEPPFGVPGKIFDAVVGRVIAKRTLRNLLEDLALDIESRYVVEGLMRNRDPEPNCHPEVSKDRERALRHRSGQAPPVEREAGVLN